MTELKIHILSFVHRPLLLAPCPVTHIGKLVDILRWLEVSMLNICTIVPLFSEKHEFQIDLIVAQSFISGRGVIHPQV